MHYLVSKITALIYYVYNFKFFHVLCSGGSVVVQTFRVMSNGRTRECKTKTWRHFTSKYIKLDYATLILQFFIEHRWLRGTGEKETRVKRGRIDRLAFVDLARVVRKVNNTIHGINRYPVDSVACFVNTYLLDSD